MKTTMKQVPPMQLAKSLVRSCPTGRCKHQHVKGSGPCIELGCGCHGKEAVFKQLKKGGR